MSRTRSIQPLDLLQEAFGRVMPVYNALFALSFSLFLLPFLPLLMALLIHPFPPTPFPIRPIPPFIEGFGHGLGWSWGNVGEGLIQLGIPSLFSEPLPGWLAWFRLLLIMVISPLWGLVCILGVNPLLLAAMLLGADQARITQHPPDPQALWERLWGNHWNLWGAAVLDFLMGWIQTGVWLFLLRLIETVVPNLIQPLFIQVLQILATMVAVFLMFSFYPVVLDGQSPWEGIRRSVQWVNRHRGLAFGSYAVLTALDFFSTALLRFAQWLPPIDWIDRGLLLNGLWLSVVLIHLVLRPVTTMYKLLVYRELERRELA